MQLILSCEHGGNEIPEQYNSLFKGKQSLLNSHRGYDPGTLDLFKYLQKLAVFSKSNTISRLLIECNRSLHHPNLFSEISKSCTSETKKQLIKSYYLPYRTAIEKEIELLLKNGDQVLHISLHSFTPRLEKEVRINDIGLLYDPKIKAEKDFSSKLKSGLLSENDQLKIRYNYPYRGNADGFTTFLRKKFKQNYIGIELEINQSLLEDLKFSENLKKQLKNTIKQLIS
ncbi:N-formylglutamate amidohydrolase [Ulvibacter antarcticus]|uniref:Putative N-formylglutamate amidohydrolase n=1 Tax=Ulvibacter antarcticus TaxID=442714 RepID=A0A3L9YDJ2_9FLAO|nr:N-formylglutamate amidohydrolase [Ulvibacter antarcticus]RMA58534.1 putative N-formylglutamate amidohydrolase [Ulvibacter antarcticus]